MVPRLIMPPVCRFCFIAPTSLTTAECTAAHHNKTSNQREASFIVLLFLLLVRRFLRRWEIRQGVEATLKRTGDGQPHLLRIHETFAGMGIRFESKSSSTGARDPRRWSRPTQMPSSPTPIALLPTDRSMIGQWTRLRLHHPERRQSVCECREKGLRERLLGRVADLRRPTRVLSEPPRQMYSTRIALPNSPNTIQHQTSADNNADQHSNQSFPTPNKDLPPSCHLCHFGLHLRW
jgi:hypothetical protein